MDKHRSHFNLKLIQFHAVDVSTMLREALRMRPSLALQWLGGSVCRVHFSVGVRILVIERVREGSWV